MSIKDQILSDLTEAMKSKDAARLKVLRSIKTGFQEKEISERKGGEAHLTEEQYFEVLTKAAKQRRDSIEQFTAGNREDLAAIEREELAVIESYLPEMMAEDEIRKIAADKIRQLGASGPQDMGKVMGTLMKELKGKADGSLISAVVKQELTK